MDWIIEETRAVDFNDKRLDTRFRKLLHTLSEDSEKSICGVSKTCGETLAAYRFFNHKNITPLDILSSHQASTAWKIFKNKGQDSCV